MSKADIRTKSIHSIHESMDLGKPKHPLITVIDASQTEVPKERVGSKVIGECYMVALKDGNCGIDYGRNAFDFDKGVLVFTAPGQAYTFTREVKKGEVHGWIMYFHPDLIRNTHLESIIDDYSFFNYDVYEALHLSEDEERVVNDCMRNIKHEYEQRIDNHSQRVIVSSLELLLNYARRYYERQFNTRTNHSTDIAAQFERELKNYYKTRQANELGMPSIQRFAESAHLSQHYFSDLIKKSTGRSPKDHINDFVIEQAKSLLMGTEQSVSEIAYDLGFNYPHYFTRLFKSKTGQTPVEYRSLN